MADTEIVTALDVGSGKVTCVIAARDGARGKVRVLGGAVAESKGLKNGMVTSIEDAARSITEAVEKAETRAGQAVVSDVILGVRGPHIYAMETRGRHAISRMDQEITQEDVSNAIENSKALSLDHGTEILHVVPQKFSLDRLPGVPNPVGMQGSLLEAETFTVMGSMPAVTNLIKSVSEAGFRLADEPVYTALALGELVVSEEEKGLGTLLIDIGGQTTSVAIYADGAIRYAKELPLGGDYITRDLAHGLGTTQGWARELKEKYGAAYSTMIKKDLQIKIMKADRRTQAEVSPKDFLPYIQPRVEEIFETIYEAVQKSAYSDLSGGIILSGGGSLLKGMPEAAAALLELPQARLAYPVQEMLECPEEYLAMPYLSAVALTCYPYLRGWTAELPRHYRGGHLKRLWRWISEMF